MREKRDLHLTQVGCLLLVSCCLLTSCNKATATMVPTETLEVTETTSEVVATSQQSAVTRATTIATTTTSETSTETSATESGGNQSQTVPTTQTTVVPASTQAQVTTPTSVVPETTVSQVIGVRSPESTANIVRAYNYAVARGQELGLTFYPYSATGEVMSFDELNGMTWDLANSYDPNSSTSEQCADSILQRIIDNPQRTDFTVYYFHSSILVDYPDYRSLDFYFLVIC